MTRLNTLDSVINILVGINSPKGTFSKQIRLLVGMIQSNNSSKPIILITPFKRKNSLWILQTICFEISVSTRIYSVYKAPYSLIITAKSVALSSKLFRFPDDSAASSREKSIYTGCLIHYCIFLPHFKLFLIEQNVLTFLACRSTQLLGIR